MENPKVFISYSWHPKENQIRVQQLAERLSSDGVHVIIDIWDLQDGQDKNKFMEQMVANPEVKKVLLICNKEYAVKANARKGGVGIESTIVSEEIYQKSDQTKFIPIVYEYDDEGNPWVPVFAKSRIFIDLSSDDKFEEGYDQLLRDIYDKPLYQRPPIGQMPTYLNSDAPTFLKTTGKVSRIKMAIEKESKRTNAVISDYIDTFLKVIPEYKIEIPSNCNAQKIVELVESSISSIQVLKDDFIDFLSVIVSTEYCTSELFQDFFERMLQTYEDNDIQLLEGSDYQSYLVDNYRFFNYELFLSFVTVMINNNRFDVVSDIVKGGFCIIPRRRIVSAEMRTYRRFQSYIATLNKVKHNLTNSRRVSITADTVKQYTTILRFEDLVASDLLLYYLSLIFPGSGYFDTYWYPDLSIYNNFVELYPRLVSKRYFDKFKRLFDVDTVEEYKKLISSVQEPNVREGYHRIPAIKYGLCFDTVATMN